MGSDLDVQNHKAVSSGYDWSNSIFDDPSTRVLKGIIYFSLSDYGSRKFIFNPRFDTGETPMVTSGASNSEPLG